MPGRCAGVLRRRRAAFRLPSAPPHHARCAGAKLTVIEINKGEGVYWHNPVTDIVVAEGATLSHFRLQDESTEAFHLATIRAEIAGNGAYEALPR